MLRVVLFLLFSLKVLAGISQKQCPCQNFNDFYSVEKLYYSNDFDNSHIINLYKKNLIDNNFGDLSHLLNTIDKVIKFGDIITIKEFILQIPKKGGNLSDVIDFLNRYPTLENSKFLLIDSIAIINNELEFKKGLDSLLIKELLWMSERDQYVRSNDSLFKRYNSFIDSSNFSLLLDLIKLNNNKLPEYHKIGSEASTCLNSLLMHMSIQNLSDILPFIIKAIRDNGFYDNTNILYQIDRNHIGNDSIFRINKSTLKLYPFLKNKEFHPKAGYFQYYGGIELFDDSSMKKYFWPFHPEANKDIQQELYDVLCLPNRNFGFPPSKIMPIVTDNNAILQILKIKQE